MRKLRPLNFDFLDPRWCFLKFFCYFLRSMILLYSERRPLEIQKICASFYIYLYDNKVCIWKDAKKTSLKYPDKFFLDCFTSIPFIHALELKVFVLFPTHTHTYIRTHTTQTELNDDLTYFWHIFHIYTLVFSKTLSSVNEKKTYQNIIYIYIHIYIYIVRIILVPNNC